MKALIDINVMLDYLQRREPFFEDAASVIDAVHYGRIQAALAAHAVTTIHYFLQKGTDKQRVEEALRWLIKTFDIVPAGARVFADSIDLGMVDYEDAVTSQCALDASCDFIVTRGKRDFIGSPIPPRSPNEFLKLIDKH